MPMMAPSCMDFWYRGRHGSSRAEVLAHGFTHKYSLCLSPSVSGPLALKGAYMGTLYKIRPEAGTGVCPMKA